MKLSLTYSACREMGQICGNPRREIGEAILDLTENPMPFGSSFREDHGGCLALPVDRYEILYHVDRRVDALTVFGILGCGSRAVH